MPFIQSPSSGHLDQAKYQMEYAGLLQIMYENSEDIQDLKAVLEHKQAANELLPYDHPDKAEYLQSLAGSYTHLFQKLGQLKDLQAALQYNQTAVDFISKGHPDRAGYLQSLAVLYSYRYWKLDNPRDLEAALQYNQAALDLTAEDHPSRAQRLQNLAISYNDQYRRQGDLTYLEAALQYKLAAINLTPVDHPDRARHLQNLAVSYSDRYQRLGSLTDLEATLKYKQAAVDLVPGDHIDRAQFMHSLALSHNDRYRRLGDIKDLEAALQYKQAAVELTAESHPNRAQSLQSLALSYYDRYQRLSALKDLEASLLSLQAALKLTPEGHPKRALRLQSLGVSYSDRYSRLGELKDFEAGLQYKLAALGLTATDHPGRPQLLQNISASYTDRYKRVGDLKDLEKALQYTQAAVELTPKDHPERADRVQKLAVSYIVRYEKVKKANDLELICTHFKASMDLMTSTPESCWKNALLWASFAARYQPEYCIAAFKYAFRLLPEILWIGHSIPVCHAAIQQLDIIQTISTATHTCIYLSDFTSAVEIIEQGLSTIYQQMLQLKTAVDNLPTEKARLFQHLSTELYTRGSNLSMNLVNQRNDLIKDIRKQPGFEYFLLPKPYKVLCQASQRGPVVILNSCEKGCDGIIILNPTSQPVHVSFPHVTLEVLGLQRTILWRLHGHRVQGESESIRLFGDPEIKLSTSEQYTKILSWLWTCIVDPVYQALKSHGILYGRLWWLPTGAFAQLPLHACPPLDQNDQFIHSYTATLESLLEAYNRKPPNTSHRLGIVGVTQTNSAGANYLNGVQQEVEAICSVAKQNNKKCLTGGQATVDAVTAQLQTCSWLHLACYGKQDLLEPTKSCLLLYGGVLELETILRMPLSNAEVVFLSACQTAMGDGTLVNEAFHLGGGFIAAGFRGAVGTLWPTDNQDSSLVATYFYSHLFGGGRQPKAGDAAGALQLAIKKLRRKNVPYERWIPFIHMGV
ncbi:CHAT domain-containing protein [Mycena pura]|uniref:CHAT domain-containing protein n=1 Tax=Mycena pura TaxID=153505 RepID=A0AAD6YR51_9AGAR|nr:CHAT domain-containing protein [Mycena pura]